MPSFRDWITIIAGIAIPVLGGLWWAIKMFIENRHLRREVNDYRAEGDNLREEIKRFKNRDVQPFLNQIEALNEELRTARAEKEAARAQKDETLAHGNELVKAYRAIQCSAKKKEDQLARITSQKEAADAECKRLQIRNEEFSRQIHFLEKQVDAMRAQDGRLWQRPVAGNVQPFRHRSERGFPIISVLNLKGGVGKTTITAHLAGTLGKSGKKVLAVDLDYQRSLSMMLVSNEKRKILHLEQRCLQHFLGNERHGADELLACAHTIGLEMENCSIITNSDLTNNHSIMADASDSLEETESRLMAEWLVQRKHADVRFFLREALHDVHFAGKFDYVLLDCPPRLTTACINALAASDYVLIPIVLDALSTRALPELLRSLLRLRDGPLADLSVLGVVANLVSLTRGELVRQEADVWEELPFGLANVWGDPVCFFKAKIPDKAHFGRATGSLDQGELKLALTDENIQQVFADLVTEIEKEIESHERSRTSAVSA